MFFFLIVTLHASKEAKFCSETLELWGLFCTHLFFFLSVATVCIKSKKKKKLSDGISKLEKGFISEFYLSSYIHCSSLNKPKYNAITAWKIILALHK